MQCSKGPVNSARGLLSVVVLGAGLSACAHRPSEQLVDARHAYDDAAASPAREHRPNELEAAHIALQRAEDAHDADPRSQREKRLATEAERRAIIVRAHGEEAEAEHDAKHAEREAAAARERAERAERTSATAEARRDERAEARAEDRSDAAPRAGEKSERARERRSSAALQNLASVASVREEPRGIVITLAGSLLFPSGHEELSPIARQNLDQVAHAMAEQPAGTKFEVLGHTDNSGAPGQNKQLSLQRARAVADQLNAAGIERDRVEVECYGETRPIAGNDTPEGRASNRRVEIVVERPVKTASR